MPKPQNWQSETAHKHIDEIIKLLLKKITMININVQKMEQNMNFILFLINFIYSIL